MEIFFKLMSTSIFNKQFDAVGAIDKYMALSCLALYRKIIPLALINVTVACFLTACGGGSDEPNTRVIDIPLKISQTIKSNIAWYTINNNPPFAPRDHASLMKVGNRLHLLGGFYRDFSSYQDYWISDDYGINWTHIHGNVLPIANNLLYPVVYEDSNIPGSFARFGYFDSYYWLIDKKIWYSRDGIVWFKYVGLDGDIIDTSALVNINLNGKLVSVDPGNNLTWNFGPNFTRSIDAAINAEFSNRDGAVVYFNSGNIYVAGGVTTSYGIDKDGRRITTSVNFNNQIWQSKDGIKWKRLVDTKGVDVQLPWSNIEWPCAVNDNRGRTWLVGGYDYVVKRNVSDVWVTSDGVNWDKYIDNVAANETSALFPRHATSCVFDEINSRLISIAGKGGVDPNNDSSTATNSIVAIPIDMN